MGTLESLMSELWKIFSAGALGPAGALYEVATGTDLQDTGTVGAVDASSEMKVKPMFLGPTAVVLGGVALAPFIYKAYSSRLRGKRAKRASELGEAIESSANRATAVLAALIPAVGIPIAYIGVQELEARGVISKGLGDAVQGLMAAGVVAPAVGAVGSFMPKG